MTSKPADIDPVDLARQLVQCESVTPHEGGALDLLENCLSQLGFNCTRLPFAEVDNLYARFGAASPNFCFAGHTDVVPPGNPDDWAVDPFSAAIIDGRMVGRGTADMKAAIASFVSAAQQMIAQGDFKGSISFLITGDEEGPAINGTVKVLEWLADKGETLDMCLVGEPTNPNVLGEMAKIGRRGSLNAIVTVKGTQGHVAYPDRADNPVGRLVKLLSHLPQGAIDDGTNMFQPSNLEVTGLSTTTQTHNVIPADATALLNVRFNVSFTGESLMAFIRSHLDEAGLDYEIEFDLKGDPFETA
ncbi:MAG: succinyl-diaminopimelate desuccinylase, partial [Sphingomonadales bacterium]|nr:succinyl-diaminopimelate desuccinylase [Sphingomonadales bacterium]